MRARLVPVSSRLILIAGVALACSCSATFEDLRSDAGLDAGGADAGSDAGTDAGDSDAGFDAGFDAGTEDAGVYDAGLPSQRQVQRPLGSTDAGNGFYEYLPPHYEDLVPRPLLVFWHGIGENGNGTTELSRVLANGPPRLIANDTWPLSRPFIVLSPQHTNNGGCPNSAEVRAFIDWAIVHYRVNARQVFLTALSCGAIGSWDYLGNNTNTVAAAVLIAGDPGDPAQSYSTWGRQGCNLGNLALWAFHGDADSVVNINNEQNTMNLLLACPAPPRLDAVWTPIAGGGHNVWDEVYDGTRGDIYAWLLAHAKP
jgi:poly(3-hydroxybutyrate) depolymerase